MFNIDLALLLKFSGILHLGLLAAGALMPSVVGLRTHMAALPPFIRRLFWVYYAFLGLCLFSFGSFTFAFANELARGTALGRAICLFFAVFWMLRLVVATFVFDLRAYLTSRFRRIGYHATNMVFAYLPVVYGWAAWKGGAP
jgi:hypothetical protein